MKNLQIRTVLFISAGIIVLVWIYKLIRNVFYLERILHTFESWPQLFLEASVASVLTIFTVTLLLRLAEERYRAIGFEGSAVIKQLRNGFLFGVSIFFLDILVLDPVLDALLPQNSPQGIEMSSLFKDIRFLPVFLFIGLFKGGFSEELWRIFTLTRFEKIFGKSGLILALLLSSAMFGVGHLYQGIGGMISVGTIGFLYALVYLRKRRALEAVTAHAAFNSIQIILGYIVYFGK